MEAPWLVFAVVLAVALGVDLLLHREARRLPAREALVWSAAWVALALAFGVFVYLRLGGVRALEYFTGYIIEKALSVDNLFVFAVVFGYFAVPEELQPRVLFWGVIGALALRAVFVVAGVALLHAFHWVTYVFGGFLLLTGARLATQREGGLHPERNPVVRLYRRFVPSVPGWHGARFLTREDGKLRATPLLLVLVVVEATDIVFAVDSIPAIFAVTDDPFIVYTSNAFAILGLRALYFVLAGGLGRFHLLRYGLALVLVFVGTKMLLRPVWDMPVWISLVVITVLLGGAVVLSLVKTRPGGEHPSPASPAG